MKRWLSKRLSIMRTPFKSSIPSVWELLPDYTPVPFPRGCRGAWHPLVKVGTEVQSSPGHAHSHGMCQPHPWERTGAGLEFVNILFIISITLLHYSLFHSLLFYY